MLIERFAFQVWELETNWWRAVLVLAKKVLTSKMLFRQIDEFLGRSIYEGEVEQVIDDMLGSYSSENAHVFFNLYVSDDKRMITSLSSGRLPHLC